MNGSVLVQTGGLLVLSNVFMTFAWYAHLRDLREKPWVVAALVSWGIALFEYLLQVPANRLGYAGGPVLHETAAEVGLSVGRALHVRGGVLHLPQLKEPFMRSPQIGDPPAPRPRARAAHGSRRSGRYLWAALCRCGAVYFIFRN
jgi:uncharacterized protein